MQTLHEQELGAKATISSYPDKGWKLSTVKKVCRLESTTVTQPFWVNQAVGDLPQHLHVQFVIRQFSHW